VAPETGLHPADVPSGDHPVMRPVLRDTKGPDFRAFRE
jgi:hypothetical protein